MKPVLFQFPEQEIEIKLEQVNPSLKVRNSQKKVKVSFFYYCYNQEFQKIFFFKVWRIKKQFSRPRKLFKEIDSACSKLANSEKIINA